jgi:signal transduction histidine kinase
MPGWARASRLLGSAGADPLLALSLFAAIALEVALRGLEPVTVVSGAVCTLPLAMRRRAPLLAALGVLGSVLVQRALGGSPESLDTGGFLVASIVATYTVAARHAWPVALLGASIVLIGVWLLLSWMPTPTADGYAYASAMRAVPLLAGRLVRDYRQRARQLRSMAARLERERDASARLAVAEERARMARELHDAIAHAVSLMVVQAAAAGAVMATAPAGSAQALLVVQETGRGAIAELRRMLHMLRAEDHSPTPETRTAELATDTSRWRSPVAWSGRLDALMALVCLALAEIAVLSEAA